jgi:subtilisin-like proprotein convertase family protein
VGLGLFNGSVIATVDPKAEAPRSEALILTVRDAGQYYLFVDGFGAPAGTPYHLSVNVIPADNGLKCNTFQTTDVMKPIGPEPGTVQSSIVLTDTAKYADVNLALLINHSEPSDLQLSLNAPNGTTVPLIANVPDVLGKSFDLMQTGFDDEAGVTPYPVWEHILYQPQAPNVLAAFDGKQPQGNWTLIINDTVAGNGGTLLDWRLELCKGKKPAKPAFEKPSPNAEFDKTKVKFDWDPTKRAAWYTLLIRSDAEDGPIVAEVAPFAATQKKVNLPGEGDYFVQLGACNPIGCKNSTYLPIIIK